MSTRQTKTKLLLVIAFLFFIHMLSNKSFAGTIGGVSYSIDTSNKTATIVGCSDSAVTVNIPEKVENNYTVTSISNYAFQEKTNLKSVTIPSSVKEIGGGTFYNCTNLTTVTINAKIDEIPYYMFWGCSKLTTVNIPKSVTEIGSNAFQDCISLKSIEIPNKVTSIGYAAFRGCKSLTNVKMYDSVTNLDWYAFEECEKLQSIKLSKNIKIISKGVFSGCTKLSSVTMPPKIESIYYYAFENCTSLNSLSIPSGTTYVDMAAFNGCKSLTRLVVPKSVTSISGYKIENVSSNFKLHVESDSKAYEWAVNNNVKYQIITPNNVKNLKAVSSSETAIRYEWSAVSGATGYRVYTYNYSSKKWEYYGKTTNSYMILRPLKSGTVYNVRVRAYKIIDGTYYFSSGYSSAVKWSTKPSKVKTLNVTAGTQKATLKWSAANGATGYKVYMSTSKNGTYKLVKMVSSGTQYTVTGLTKGQTYYFKVMPYKKLTGCKLKGVTNDYVCGTWSDIKSVNIK